MPLLDGPWNDDVDVPEDDAERADEESREALESLDRREPEEE